MPEPFLYLQSMAAAAISATCVLMVVAMRCKNGELRTKLAGLLSCTVGIACGEYVLRLHLNWPPTNGLDRFLTLVLPLVLGVELMIVFTIRRPWMAWLWRVALALTIPIILLYGSVYLTRGAELDRYPWQAGTRVVLCGGLLASVWGLIVGLSQRCPGISIPCSLGISTLCAGLTVMMAGYLKGGAAAFPLAAALLATTVGMRRVWTCRVTSADWRASALLGLGIVSLYGVLFIGRFFGGLSTGRALAMLSAPLLCWVSELLPLRHRQLWVR